MTPFGYPGTTYAPGSLIDSAVYASSEPRFAVFALAARSSRSGPTFAVEPAGLNVWQALHPWEANSALPAAAFPAGAAGAGVVPVLWDTTGLRSSTFAPASGGSPAKAMIAPSI